MLLVGVEVWVGYFDYDIKCWVMLKYYLGGKLLVKCKWVNYSGLYILGMIFIDMFEWCLYYILENGKVMKYGVGVGKDGFQWVGIY